MSIDITPITISQTKSPPASGVWKTADQPPAAAHAIRSLSLGQGHVHLAPEERREHRHSLDERAFAAYRRARAYRYNCREASEQVGAHGNVSVADCDGFHVGRRLFFHFLRREQENQPRNRPAYREREDFAPVGNLLERRHKASALRSRESRQDELRAFLENGCDQRRQHARAHRVQKSSAFAAEVYPRPQTEEDSVKSFG